MCLISHSCIYVITWSHLKEASLDIQEAEILFLLSDKTSQGFTGLYLVGRLCFYFRTSGTCTTLTYIVLYIPHTSF